MLELEPSLDHACQANLEPHEQRAKCGTSNDVVYKVSACEDARYHHCYDEQHCQRQLGTARMQQRHDASHRRGGEHVARWEGERQLLGRIEHADALIEP